MISRRRQMNNRKRANTQHSIQTWNEINRIWWCEMSLKCHQVLAACFNQRRSLFINKDQQQLATKVKYLKAQRENCGSREKSIDTNPEPFLLVMPGVCLKIQTNCSTHWPLWLFQGLQHYKLLIYSLPVSNVDPMILRACAWTCLMMERGSRHIGIRMFYSTVQLLPKILER